MYLLSFRCVPPEKSTPGPLLLRKQASFVGLLTALRLVGKLERFRLSIRNVANDLSSSPSASFAATVKRSLLTLGEQFLFFFFFEWNRADLEPRRVRAVSGGGWNR